MYINLITIDLCPGQNGGGVSPSGTLTISTNGEYNVYSYASASVDVHPSISLSETYLSNGSYTITGEFNGGMVTVNVPSPQFVTEPLSVSANGTYTPGQGVDGYSQVVVDVPQSVTGFTEKDLTEGAIDIINLNNSASFVAGGAFFYNNTIQTVNLPYATYVNNYAFTNCNSLSQVSLPVCSYIGEGAFRYCISLSQVSLPMCEYVYDDAFQNCSILNSIYLPVVRSIGSVCFNNCRSLSSIMLPECIDLYRNVFTGCSMLSTIVLPKLQTVDDRAFRCLSNQFGYTLSLYMGGSDVVNTGSAVASTLFFTDTEKHIYVRSSLIDMYRQHSIWGQINNVQWFNYEDSPYYTE